MKLGAQPNQQQDTNYYEVLEIQEHALPHEIHKAYTRAKATYSTENPALYSMFSPEEARELLRLIEEAYSVLGNPGLRKSYDESRLRGERPTHVSLVTPTPAMYPNPAAYSSPAPYPNQLPQEHQMVQTPQPFGYPPANYPPTPPPASASAPVAHSVAPPVVPPWAPAPPPAQMAAPIPPPPAQAPAPYIDPGQLVQEHRALPDFVAPGAIAESFAPPPPAQKPVLPEGVGRTTLSTYKIDEAFEEELKSISDFDGSVLQRTRLYKNVSIDRLSESTRISRTYIMAIETNDYKSLPAAVFTRGFIVQIARILGLQENSTASSYIKMFKAGGGK